ncbi:uncharacterized protein LOC122019334 [Zingiber officinale]|uniref:uncharacterized protein LOC122019334 n=1 Tax=Zingiber officinale TaxID=94328 RepID=UPI001C4CE218|nr:uncharacterized protein LOC122019334 [Zingiber officinale]
MTAGEYELFKEVRKQAASERQGTVSRPRLAPEASKELAPASDRSSKRKQPEELPRASFREPKKEEPPASVAESSLHPPRDSGKGKVVILAEDLPEDPDDKALADFLTEVYPADSEEVWKIYVDGSANHCGSGVGALLISPQGDIMQLVVRLSFRATNNEAEYEALLTGLQAARHVGASRVIIHSDSQLVTQQTTGQFGVNSERMQVYKEAYEKMKGEFKEITVTKIPRTENERADELAKMASSLNLAYLTSWYRIMADNSRDTGYRIGARGSA